MNSARRRAEWSYEHVWAPLGHKITAAAEFLFVTLPQAFYNHVLIPVAKAVKEGARLIYKYILTPIGKAMQFLFYYLPVQFFTFVLRPIGQAIAAGAEVIYQKIVRPIGDGLSKAAHFLFSELPVHFQNYVLIPVKEGVVSAAHSFKVRVIDVAATTISNGMTELANEVLSGVEAIRNFFASFSRSERENLEST